MLANCLEVIYVEGFFVACKSLSDRTRKSSYPGHSGSNFLQPLTTQESYMSWITIPPVRQKSQNWPQAKKSKGVSGRGVPSDPPKRVNESRESN